jgi:hypothetical protein
MNLQGGQLERMDAMIKTKKFASKPLIVPGL